MNIESIPETPETSLLLKQPLPSPEPAYVPPTVIEVGPSLSLVNSGTGKHSDSYTGYYWNGEG